MQVHDIPRTALDAYLKALRLPLDVAKGVLKPAEPWAPAVVFEQVEANVRGVAGRLLRDPDLSHQAALQKARIGQLEKAAEKLAAADAAERRADRQEQLAEQRLVEGTRQVQQKTAKKAAVARKAAAAREDVVERRQSAADRKRLDAERKALEKQQQAVKAKKKAAAIQSAAQAVR